MGLNRLLLDMTYFQRLFIKAYLFADKYDSLKLTILNCILCS